jgi:cellulose synthase/poly-beta-1,6-N-acetylglucosamine synthase-like glycosyltransferase
MVLDFFIQVLEAILLAYGILAIATMALLGLQPLSLSLLYLHYRQRRPEHPAPPNRWPTVTVQLPVYNERFVVERLIDAVCALDYPPESLSIQVIDDSTDETTMRARERVSFHRARGIQITLLHRADRQGYKAGALDEGMRSSRGEFIAIFDADFLPPTDFLHRVIPHLVGDPGLGLVQARWGHLNAGTNALTRGQAITLDTHFVVIQTVRSRSGLLMSFNGSAGVWRQRCIEQAGGWQADTLAEDLDLSYRAQLKGWRLLYLPDVVVPGEIPPRLIDLKRQQSRWAKGGIQVLRMLGRDLWYAPLSFHQKVAATFHLASYLAHPVLVVFLLCVPAILSLDVNLPHLPALSLMGIGPFMLVVLSQACIYPDWKQRLIFFPVQVLMSIGLSLNNSQAVLHVFSRRSQAFDRTPKFHLQENERAAIAPAKVSSPQWDTWGELLMAVYTASCLAFAWEGMPALAPVLALCAASYAFVAFTGFRQARRASLIAQPQDYKVHSLRMAAPSRSERGRKPQDAACA